MTKTNISLQQPPPPTTTVTNRHNDNDDRRDNRRDLRCIRISSPRYVSFMFYVLISYFTDIYYLQIYYKCWATKPPQRQQWGMGSLTSTMGPPTSTVGPLTSATRMMTIMLPCHHHHQQQPYCDGRQQCQPEHSQPRHDDDNDDEQQQSWWTTSNRMTREMGGHLNPRYVFFHSLYLTNGTFFYIFRYLVLVTTTTRQHHQHHQHHQHPPYPSLAQNVRQRAPSQHPPPPISPSLTWNARQRGFLVHSALVQPHEPLLVGWTLSPGKFFYFLFNAILMFIYI